MVPAWLPPWAAEGLWYLSVALMCWGGISFTLYARSLRRDYAEAYEAHDQRLSTVDARLDQLGVPGLRTTRDEDGLDTGPIAMPAAPAAPNSAAKATDAALAQLRTALDVPPPPGPLPAPLPQWDDPGRQRTAVAVPIVVVQTADDRPTPAQQGGPGTVPGYAPKPYPRTGPIALTAPPRTTGRHRAAEPDPQADTGQQEAAPADDGE